MFRTSWPQRSVAARGGREEQHRTAARTLAKTVAAAARVSPCTVCRGSGQGEKAAADRPRGGGRETEQQPGNLRRRSRREWCSALIAERLLKMARGPRHFRVSSTISGVFGHVTARSWPRKFRGRLRRWTGNTPPAQYRSTISWRTIHDLRISRSMISKMALRPVNRCHEPSAPHVRPKSGAERRRSTGGFGEGGPKAHNSVRY